MSLSEVNRYRQQTRVQLEKLMEYRIYTDRLQSEGRKKKYRLGSNRVQQDSKGNIESKFVTARIKIVINNQEGMLDGGSPRLLHESSPARPKVSCAAAMSPL